MRQQRAAAIVVTAVLAGLAACASTPKRESPDGDRTRDPEFVAARAGAQPEFETQADALAAGVYEPFVHPDSVPGRMGPPPGVILTTPRVAGDPSTEELIGTLGESSTYNLPSEKTLAAPPPRPENGGGAGGGTWTLQMGAFGSETGALVRIRQLERDFPDLARWFTAGDVYRVFVGRFADRVAAERTRAVALDRGYADAWVTLVP